MYCFCGGMKYFSCVSDFRVIFKETFNSFVNDIGEWGEITDLIGRGCRLNSHTVDDLKSLLLYAVPPRERYLPS